MTPTLRKAAHTVLLPAFADTRLSEGVKRFLDNGGYSILIGESREEYIARTMSRTRRANETAETLSKLTNQAKSYRPEIIVAVDQEISGICRLHDLVPPFPNAEALAEMTTKEFGSICFNIGHSARKLGINCFLAPILDLVSGSTPWLEGRTWTIDASQLTRISCAFIAGVQRAGLIACAKHFPGYGAIALDPAIDAGARNDQPLAACQENIAVFQSAINQGVDAIMCGPAIVSALDPAQPASTSPVIIGSLKNDLNFSGLVVSDDLDAKATLLGRSLTETAIQSLKSGCDLLLVGDSGDTLAELSRGICRAAETGLLSEERLLQAANSVQSLAGKYS